MDNIQIIPHNNTSIHQAILSTPKCLLDELTVQILKKWDTPQKLMSADCIAVLAAMAVLIRFEICRIECRNAQLRRYVKANETVASTLRLVSGKFLLQRARRLQHAVANAAQRSAKVSSR